MPLPATNRGRLWPSNMPCGTYFGAEELYWVKKPVLLAESGMLIGGPLKPGSATTGWFIACVEDSQQSLIQFDPRAGVQYWLAPWCYSVQIDSTGCPIWKFSYKYELESP